MPGNPTIFRARARANRDTLNAEYDDRRGSARARGYTAQWDNASALFKRQHPLCLGCDAIGRVTVVTVVELVDHVEPHKGDAAKFWNADLWQPSCRWHHDVVKQRLERAFAKGELKLADLWLNSAAAVRLSLSIISANASL
jgi:5-methylcytosine-specific restriction endonuclease McrA